MFADTYRKSSNLWGAKSARRQISLVLALLLLTTLWLGATSAAFAAGDGAAEAGTALAVVRIGGATLFDAAGAPLRDLPANMRLTVHGRSTDGAWLQVATRDGASGWVQKEQMVAFGLSNLPVMTDFQEPASPAEASSAAAVGDKIVSLTDQTATVNTAGGHLNVRSGPGTSYAVIARLAAGQNVPLLARNQTGDWVQIARPAPDDGFGWVSASLVTLDGAAGDLPVSEAISDAPALPVAATTQPAQSTRAANGLSGTIVFQDRSGGAIYAYDPASGSTRQIATGADPALTPDGRQVAFWRDEDGQHTLFTANIDGNGEQRLLTRGEMIRAPSWSPDGQRIVFSRVVGERRCRDVGFGICMPDLPPYSYLFPLVVSDKWGLSSVDLQGAGFHDLPTQYNAIAPDWGQDGIVYDGPVGIELTGDGDDAVNRSLLSDFKYHDPSFQPGGNHIVFQSLEKDHWEIFTATNDGANVTALTRPATTLYAPLPHNVAPVWSPDGQHILFLSNRSGDWALWVMNADGSGQRQLPIDVPIAYDYSMEQVASWR